jgi:hypothetical protein
MKDYTREELISLCEKSVVHHTKWEDRDSFLAQKKIQSIYKGLTAGLIFTIDKDTDDRTIWISFDQPIDFELLEDGKYLKISSREDYFNDCDPDYESEMFDGEGIDFNSNYTSGYMPTQKRIDEVGQGNDWY